MVFMIIFTRSSGRIFNAMHFTDRSNSFPFDYESNGILFGANNQKENCRYDYIPFNLHGIGNLFR